MRGRRALSVLTGVVLAIAGCGGSTTEPFRIGILSDCYGPFSSAHELVLASAELPLIERGGKLRGRNPSSGIEGTSVAGRRVELLVGCVTGTTDVIPEARRLVEGEGADVLVGPLYPHHGPVLRDYAGRQPGTAFLIQPSGAPEVTLSRPLPNVFRFTLDNAQNAAGLGSYAFHELGWRTATTLADDTPYGWGNVAGFVAEFCALGGRIVDREWMTLGQDPVDLVPRIGASADGVYLGAAISPLQGFVRRYSEVHDAVSRRLLANAVLLPQVVAHARGVVAAGGAPFEPTDTGQAYAVAFAKAFPSFPAASALSPLAVPYRDGVAAAVEAFERADGRTGAELMTALARVKLDSPTGPVALDANRQAVGPNYLSRVVEDAQGKPAIRTLRVVRGVEQSFGGYFDARGAPPSRTAPACRRHAPPRWARR
jgi:branched-chain amino acid transport system substrate-binding protein